MAEYDPSQPSMTLSSGDSPNPMFAPPKSEYELLLDRQKADTGALTNTQAVSNALMAQQQALPQPTMPGAPQLGNSRVKRPNRNSGYAAMGDALGSLGRQGAQAYQGSQLSAQQEAEREALRQQMAGQQIVDQSMGAYQEQLGQQNLTDSTRFAEAPQGVSWDTL